MSKKFLSPIKLAQGDTNPSTGSAGELFYNTTDSKIYTHNGTSWVASGGGVTNSATMPSNPANGDAWFNTNEGTLFVYYSDGTSNQWVEATAPSQGVASYQLPAGSIMAWGGSAAPTNWMIADGTAISRTTYASLFAAIGTTYGSGDGSTTFNLPNLKGRVVAGLDASQTEFNTLGETGGAKTHTLTTSEMPIHSHSVTDPGHSHNVLGDASDGTAVLGVDAAAASKGGSYSGLLSSSGTGISINNEGGGVAHNNLQPYIVLNYIIKYSAGETPGDSELATRIGVAEVELDRKWESYNYIINGAFDIWQRATSAVTNAANTYKTADRWVGYKNNAGATESRQAAGLAGFQYCGRYQRDSGVTTTDQLWAYQSIETINSIPLAGKTVTLSFYARAGANYSASASGLLVQLRSGTGTDQNALAGFTGSATPISQVATLTTSWQRFAYTTTLDSGITQLGVVFIETPTGTAGSADYYDITGVQLEEGPNATVFKRNSPSIQAELAACQRYYEVVVPPSGVTGAGFINSATNAYVHIPFKVTKRASATVTYVGTLSGITALWTGGGNAATGFSSPGGTDSAFVVITTSGLSGGQGIMFNTSSAVKIVASAEI